MQDAKNTLVKDESIAINSTCWNENFRITSSISKQRQQIEGWEYQNACGSDCSCIRPYHQCVRGGCVLSRIWPDQFRKHAEAVNSSYCAPATEPQNRPALCSSDRHSSQFSSPVALYKILSRQ